MLSLKEYAMLALFEPHRLHKYFIERFKPEKIPEHSPNPHFIPQDWFTLKKMIPLKELRDQVVKFRMTYYGKFLDSNMIYSFHEWDHEIIEAHVTFKTVKTKRIFIDGEWRVLERSKLKKRRYEIDTSDDPCPNKREWPFRRDNVETFITRIKPSTEDKVGMSMQKDLQTVKLKFQL